MSSLPPEDDEIHLFRETIGKVQRLESRHLFLETQKPKPRKRHKPSIENGFSNHPLNSGEHFHISRDDHLNYLSTGLKKDVINKLRSGFFQPEAELDLHGLTEREASRHLNFFLNEVKREKLGCVLIIHGKGYGSENSRPLLKNRVNQWLRQHHLVLAFCSAPTNFGGAGAVFVLLDNGWG